jgi:amino-acid N-acetyltransferase
MSALQLRHATPADAPAIVDLIMRNRERWHLLPREVGEVSRRAPRFLVVTDHGRIVACAELVPLSRAVAEIRSLVVDEASRGRGLGTALVAALFRRARLDGHERLCAFAHDPTPFLRLGFSIVPHGWLPEKIAADCRRCPLFGSCGQYPLVLSLKRQTLPRPAVSVPFERPAALAATA